MSPEDFYAFRKERAFSEFERFRHGRAAASVAPEVPPKSHLGKAVGYFLNGWKKIVRYLEHSSITPNNNRIENDIRPLALGRKNRLFAGDPNGAHAAARSLTLISTAKVLGLNPSRYLHFLLNHVPLAETEENWRRLLPQNVTA